MLAEPCDPVHSLVALYDRISPAVEDAMIEAVKRLSRTVPTSRGDPFYGLDRGHGPSLRTIERLTARGDFRKYVFVLDGGGGAGSFARWISATYGCRVLVLDVLARVVAVGQRLSRRAGFAGRIAAVAGSLESIPLRDGIFTQIWSVAALHHVAERGRALRELFRVLRPGSTIALHEIVRRSDLVPPIGGPWRHGTEAEYVDLLGRAGFDTITAEDVTTDAWEPSPIARSAQAIFLRLLSDRSPTAAEAWNAGTRELERIRTIECGSDYRTVQLFARRPSL
jgi:SAM-dependent methyltransferase